MFLALLPASQHETQEQLGLLAAETGGEPRAGPGSDTEAEKGGLAGAAAVGA